MSDSPTTKVLRPPVKPAKRSLVLAFLLFTILPSPAKDWIEYTGCHLTPGAYRDGDSFSQVEGLKTGGKRETKTNWRLYGVDCAETDQREPARLKEQALAFRVPEATLNSWGKKASEFSEKFLSQPFRVMTLREDAEGASKKKRYYAIIIGADGRLLNEALVEAGLARAYGMPAPWPDKHARFEEHLKSLELSARAAHVGIWAE